MVLGDVYELKKLNFGTKMKCFIVLAGTNEFIILTQQKQRQFETRFQLISHTYAHDFR